MQAWLCLGSNLDAPALQLKRAVEYLRGKCFIKILSQSEVLFSKPFGYTEQPDFANQLLEIETPLDPQELLSFLKKAELNLGRKPSFRWGPRLIDLDIILIEDRVIKTDNLIVPHPGIAEREYLLKLLAEILPDEKHPETGQTFQIMYKDFITKGDTK